MVFAITLIKQVIFLRGGKIMFKNLKNKFERMMMAVTFAEAGEWEQARDIVDERDQKKVRKVVRKAVREGKRPVLYS
jgi:hypothetical protein